MTRLQRTAAALATAMLAACASPITDDEPKADDEAASATRRADALCIGPGSCVPTVTFNVAGDLHHISRVGAVSVVHFLAPSNSASTLFSNAGLPASDTDLATVSDLQIAVRSALPLCANDVCGADPRTGRVSIEVTLRCRVGTVLGATPPLDGPCDIKSWRVYREGVLVRSNIIPG